MASFVAHFFELSLFRPHFCVSDDIPFNCTSTVLMPVSFSVKFFIHLIQKRVFSVKKDDK